VRWQDSELAITTAAALANHLATLGEPFGFITNAYLQYFGAVQPVRKERSAEGRVVRVLPRKGTGQLMQVLEILAAAVCEPCADFVDMVSREARHFGWGASLLIVTPTDSQALVDTGVLLASSGYRVLLFVTGERVLHPHLVHHSPHPGLSVSHVTRGREQPVAIEGVVATT